MFNCRTASRVLSMSLGSQTPFTNSRKTHDRVGELDRPLILSGHIIEKRPFEGSLLTRTGGRIGRCNRER